MKDVMTGSELRAGVGSQSSDWLGLDSSAHVILILKTLFSWIRNIDKGMNSWRTLAFFSCFLVCHSWAFSYPYWFRWLPEVLAISPPCKAWCIFVTSSLEYWSGLSDSLLPRSDEMLSVWLGYTKGNYHIFLFSPSSLSLLPLHAHFFSFFVSTFLLLP